METLYTTEYVQPTMPESGYSFVPAANLYKNYIGICVYIKHTKNTTKKVLLKEEGLNHALYECPGRDVLTIFNSRDSSFAVPAGYDECYDFSTFTDATSKALGLSYVMTNFVHSKYHKLPRINLRTNPDDRIQVLSDSGGLQLSRGTSDFIHPIDLATFYNDNADAGMVLDLPFTLPNLEMFEKLAVLQKKNTDVMLKHLKGPELINIFHGMTDKERKMFRRTTEDDRVPRVAIATAGSLMPVAACHAVLDTAFGDIKYKQYHALGIFRMHLIPLLVKMANMHNTKLHITSDSTSHIQGAVNRHYYSQFDLNAGMKRLLIGDAVSLRCSLRHLPCQCPICTSVKFMDILGMGHGRTSHRLLSIHNAYEMSRYATQLQEILLSYPYKYSSIVAKHLEKNPFRQEVLYALDYIDVCDDKGFAAANRKYKYKLDERVRDQGGDSCGIFLPEVSRAPKLEEKTKNVLKNIEYMNKQLKLRN